MMGSIHSSCQQTFNPFILEESRLIFRGIVSNQESENQALFSAPNHQGKKHDYKKKHNKVNNTNLSKVKCVKCEKFGHIFSKCPERERILASLAKSKKDENLVFYSALSSEINSNESVWKIDSGTSRHITGFKDKFETLENYRFEGVTIGDNSTHPVKGIGTFSIH